MVRRKPKKGFDIPDPKSQLSKVIQAISKYRVGEKGISFYDIKKQKPVFAFDYLSLNKSVLCFNEKSLNQDDLLGFLEGLKKVSSFSYEEMTQKKGLRFHSINLWDKKVNLKPKDFLKILAPSGRGMTENELPTLYQFDLQYRIEARAVGFLYKGIFYIVWYDRNHVIYPKR